MKFVIGSSIRQELTQPANYANGNGLFLVISPLEGRRLLSAEVAPLTMELHHLTGSSNVDT